MVGEVFNFYKSSGVVWQTSTARTGNVALGSAKPIARRFRVGVIRPCAHEYCEQLLLTTSSFCVGLWANIVGQVNFLKCLLT